MKKNPLVYILILNWNGKNNSIDCINSLLKNSYPNCKIILIDNGSTDDSVKTLKTRFPNITFILNSTNLGYAEGNNVGMRYSIQNKADYVLVLNNDVIVERKFLSELIKIAESNNRIGVVGPKVYHYSDSNRIQLLGIKNVYLNLIIRKNLIGRNIRDIGQFEKILDVDFISGCAFLINSTVLKDVGLFDKKYFLYYEDADLFTRVKRRGYSIKVVPKSKIWHKEKASSASNRAFVEYYFTRNRFLFVRKHFNNLIYKVPFLISYFVIDFPKSFISLIFFKRDFKALTALFKGIVEGLFILFTEKAS